MAPCSLQHLVSSAIDFFIEVYWTYNRSFRSICIYMYCIYIVYTWFSICIYGEMSTIVNLISICQHTHLQILCVMRSFKIHTLSNFQIRDIVLLTVVMCCTWHPRTYWFDSWKFVPLDACHQFHSPSNHQSVLCYLGAQFGGNYFFRLHV